MASETGQNPGDLAPPELSPDFVPEAPGSTSKPQLPWKWIVAALVALLVIYPLARRILAPGQPATASTDRGAPPTTEADWLNRSAADCQEGRFQECIDAAKKALAINPNSAVAYNNMAAAYMSLHMPNEAYQNIQQALRLQDFPLAQNNLNWILREMAQQRGTPAAGAQTAESYVNESVRLSREGKFEESVKAAQQAVKLKPDMAEAHNNMAAAYASMGKWDQAFEEIVVALRLKPDFQLARNNLTWIVGELGKRNAAKKK